MMIRAPLPRFPSVMISGDGPVPNWLAGLVARHIIGEEDAQTMAQAMAYELPKQAYRLDD